MKNGEIITTTERCVINTDQATSTIIIKTVDHKDSAVYKVSATNKVASDSKELNLKVIGEFIFRVRHMKVRKNKKNKNET